MSGLETKDLVWVGFVAVAHAAQLGHAAREVAQLRRKHKISPPRTDGPPDFIRALRAQQNGLEFGMSFQIILWTSGIFAHQVPAALLGTAYLIARHKYTKGYIQSPEKRIGPFWWSIYASQGLIALAFAGIFSTGLREYAGIDLVAMVRERFF